MSKKWYKKKPGKYVVMAASGLVLVLVIVLIAFKAPSEPEAEILSSSTLEKIIQVSDLSTFEAIYNGIAKVEDEEDPEEILYYVSYEAKVKAGIDFNQVKIEVEDTEKVITVTLPDVKITEVNVDITSLDYIFMDKKANNETVSEEAYKKCIEDVKQECNAEHAIYELASENAKNIVEALIRPFVEQLDSEYQLVIH